MLENLLSGKKAAFQGYTELRAQENTEGRVILLGGNMVANTAMTTGGVSARVYKSGVYGFASGAEYTSESIDAILKAASDNAAFMDGHVKKGKPPLPAVESGEMELKRPMRARPAQSYVIDFSRAMDALIERKYPSLVSRRVVSQYLDIEKRLVVSDGMDHHFYQPRSVVYVTMTVNDGDGNPIELSEVLGGFGQYDELFTDPAVFEEKLEGLYKLVCDKQSAVWAQAGLRTCVMDPALAGILAHEAVGHTVEADLVLGGSVAASCMGKEVASEMVTMVDFAHTALGETCPLPVYADDEGTEAKDAMLIEKGILKGYMHSKETAQHFGHAPLGNARGYAFSDEPLIRMRNTAILPGESKLSEMISSIDDGYYLLKTGNGQADTTGEFMFGISMGYEIKGGKLGRAIRDTTISGVAFDMLKTVDMLSDDMKWECSGYCGKKQPMTVGMGGPAIRCKVNVGGK